MEENGKTDHCRLTKKPNLQVCLSSPFSTFDEHFLLRQSPFEMMEEPYGI